jgi:hypothetical protein
MDVPEVELPRVWKEDVIFRYSECINCQIAFIARCHRVPVPKQSASR